MRAPAVITIGTSPKIHLGALTLTWHGLMIAVGIAVGGWLASRLARERGLDPDAMLSIVLVIAVAGAVGSRIFYLLINAPGDLLAPGRWLGSRGFAFYGALILGPIAAAWWMVRRRLSGAYLDLAAIGFALGTAVGRVGDLLSGEHYGPVSHAPWAVRYTNPAAEVPRTGVPYQSGALYEIVLGLVIFAIVFPVRRRVTRPTSMLWLVVGLYGLGRFAMFFARSDSAKVGLGLNEAQLVSVAIVLAAAAGWVVSRPWRQRPGPG